MARKRCRAEQVSVPQADPSDDNVLLFPPLRPAHCEPRLEPELSSMQSAVPPLGGTPRSTPPPPPPMVLESDAAKAFAAALPADPTAHWGPICAATRLWISKVENLVAAALTKAGKDKCQWSTLCPEGRQLLYEDVKNVRDKAVVFGHHQVLEQVAPAVKEYKAQLARAQQDLEAERVLTKELAEENKELKAKLKQCVDSREPEPEPEDISLEEIVEHLSSASPFPYVTQPPTPLSDAGSDFSDQTMHEVSRTTGPSLSVDEIEELLNCETFEDERGSVLSVPPGAALFQS